MGITHSLDAEHSIYSQSLLLYEWLTDADCFGSQTSSERLADVKAIITQDQETLDRPRVSFAVWYISQETTGGGRLNSGKLFRRYSALIQIKTSRTSRAYAGKLGVQQLWDRLFNYFRTETVGEYALLYAGFKDCRMEGPMPSSDEHYEYINGFLRYRILE